MATTEQYLNQLIQDKSDLIAAINNKGVTVSENATFTDLPSAVESITGGGGEKYKPRIIRFQGYTGTELDYEMENLDTSLVTSLESFLEVASNLTKIVMPNNSTPYLTNTARAFYNCQALTEIDLRGMTFGNVTNCLYMFSNVRGLQKLETDEFDLSGCADLNQILTYAGYNYTGGCDIDFSKWKTSNALTNLSKFAYTSNIKNMQLTGFNTENVTTLSQAFSVCGKMEYLNLSSFNVGKCTSFLQMIYTAASLKAFDATPLAETYNSEITTSTKEWLKNANRCNALVINSDKLFKHTSTNTFTSSKFASLSTSGEYPFACIYVPESMVETYQTATNWTAYASKIKPIIYSFEIPINRTLDMDLSFITMANNWTLINLTNSNVATFENNILVGNEAGTCILRGDNGAEVTCAIYFKFIKLISGGDA